MKTPEASTVRTGDHLLCEFWGNTVKVQIQDVKGANSQEGIMFFVTHRGDSLWLDAGWFHRPAIEQIVLDWD